MAKETFTKTCWADDVNTMIAVYESFGWELISNNVSTTVQAAYNVSVSATNDLTFKRDKEAPWYGEVSQLQWKYDELQNKIDAIEESEPEEKKPSLLLTFFLCLFYIVPGIIYYVAYGVSQSGKVKKWHKNNDSVIADLKSQQVTILNQSRAVIEG